MRIGKYNVTEINTSSFGLDGGAMFGIVPKTLWEKRIAADENNRIPLQARCLLLSGGNKNILIETGIGAGYDEKFRKIYDIADERRTVKGELSRRDVKSEDITDVILTHLHFDHTGGAVTFENGKPAPSFPNAVYHIQKEQYDWAMNPSEKDAGSFLQERFHPLHEEGIVKLHEGDYELDDEIELINFEGHTPKQQLPLFKDSSGIYFYGGDLIPTAAHVPLPYIMGFDLQPLVTLKEKKELLGRAADEEWKLIMGHDVKTAMITVTKDNNNYKVKEKFGKLA